MALQFDRNNIAGLTRISTSDAFQDNIAGAADKPDLIGPAGDLPAAALNLSTDTAATETDAPRTDGQTETSLRALLTNTETGEIASGADVVNTLSASVVGLTAAMMKDLQAKIESQFDAYKAIQLKLGDMSRSATTPVAMAAAASDSTTENHHETYDEELQTYINTLSETINNLDDLTANLRYFADAVETVETVVSTIDEIGDRASEMREAIDDQLTILKLTKQAGPLKTPSKIFEDVLEAIRPVVAKIEEAVDKLNGKQDTGKDGEEEDGEFLSDLEDVLNAVQTTLNTIANELADQSESLAITQKSVEQVLDALNFAEFAEFDNLKDEVADQFSDRNDATEPLAQMFNDIADDINGVLDVINDSAITEILVDFGDFIDISNLISKIAGPLSEAAAAIKPIEGVLDTVGALVDLVLGPVFEFLTDVLGIDELLEDVTDELKKLLPDADFLQPLLDAAQDLMDSFRLFEENTFGIEELQIEIEERFFGASVGNADVGPTGFGTEASEILEGDAGDDILDAREGRDTVFGHEGNDIFIAGEGFDDFHGGEGDDMVFFEGYFAEYELIKEPGEDGKIIITHKEPPEGTQNEGATRLDSIEYVVFRNIWFTGEQLENAIIGGPIIIGTATDEENDISGDDLMFLNSLGDPGDDGFYEAYGLSGDDTIFGSTGADSLNGGSGNDVFLPGYGNDLVEDSAGLDTYQVLESGSSNNFRIDLIDGTVFGAEGSDTLIGVENLNIQHDGDHILEGDDGFNNIISADGDDVLSGRGGSDFLNGNAGKDFFITGSGKDAVMAGDGNDYIIASNAFVAGENELFIGGAGRDNLSYSDDFNIVRDILNPDSDTSNAVNAAINELTSESGSVRIFSETGRIEKLDDTGAVIAVDTAREIETFIGSDSADEIYGGYGTSDNRISVYGAGGDDMIYTRGAKTVKGGYGNDTIVAVADDEGRISGSVIEGGNDHDVLDLTGLGDVRWWFDLEGSISRSIRAFDQDYGGNMRSSGTTLFSFNVEGIEEFWLGNGSHLIENDPGGPSQRIFRTGSGNDELIQGGGFATFYADAGDDIARMDDGGIVYGGTGNDSMYWDNTSLESEGYGEAGNDYFAVERMNGHMDGGDGFDVVAFDLENTSGNEWGYVDVDLAAGTVFMEEKTIHNSFPYEHVDATLTNFEQVIGTEFGDTIRGSDAGEVLIGREGSDLLEGREGDDQLYGGDSNDTLNGGDDNDRLHGGLGNDTLNGGDGSDTADYSNASPDGLDGAIQAEGFGGVVADLENGVVTGSFGTDQLNSIENVIGTSNADRLDGGDGGNIMNGGAGDDTINGADGDDVLIAGSGNNTLNGGEHDDLLIVSTGNDVSDGGAGEDTLAFGSNAGEITLDFSQGSYTGTIEVEEAVWLDDGTTDLRDLDGNLITPEDVRQASPIFADSAADLALALPDTDDPDAELFRIDSAVTSTAVSGTFTDIEVVTGGGATVNLILSDGADHYDGTASEGDILDLSDYDEDFVLKLHNGTSDLAVAENDVLLGIDVLIGGDGKNKFTGDDYANQIIGKDGADKIDGKKGADTLEGGRGRDVVDGGNGKDLLKGGDGADTLSGDGGDDTVKGGKGSDVLDGGLGNDTVQGAGGSDEIYGDDGNDKLNGDEGKDTISGGIGDDTITGGSGQDDLSGDNGNDEISGNENDDIINGGAGKDTLTGDSGEDEIRGGSGKDFIKGGSQGDLIDGGSGNDTLDGGSGSDTFVFSEDKDEVRDFDANDDNEKIDLSAVASIDDFSDLSDDHMTQDGNHVVIDDLSGNTMTLRNTTLSDLDALDFIF